MGDYPSKDSLPFFLLLIKIERRFKMSTNIQNGCRFNPVQCTKDTFDTILAQEGYVYFITDAKKIFLGKDGEKIPMCASSGIFYGHKPIEYEQSGTIPPPNVQFSYNEIEGTEKGDIPEIDDLILNVGTEELPDGCFYRVVEVAEDVIETIRLTLQGSGGGNSGDNPDSPIISNFSISASNNQTNYYFSNNAQEAVIGIIGHSTDSTNYITKVECSFSNNIENEESKFLIRENLAYALDKNYPIDLVQHLNKMNSSGSTSIYVHVTDKYGTSRYKKFTISIVTLQITTNENSMLNAKENTYDYYVTPGGSTSLNSYTMQFEYYNEDGTLIHNEEIAVERNQLNSTIPCNLNLINIPHGSYTMKVYLTAISGITKLSSNILTHKIIHFQEGGDPILGVLLPDKMEQYTTIPINYLLVYGDSIKSYTLTMKLDGQVVTTESIISGSLEVYDLIIDKKGVYHLEIIIEELSILQEYELIISEYSGTLPVINIDRTDLEVYLTARGRTNNSTDKSYWPDSKNDARKGILSDFHFRAVDGWLKDANEVNYLKVSQGASVEFKDYSPYSKSPNTKGLTIELDFKLSGISNYSQSLIECLSLKADKNIKTGFRVTGDKFEYYVNGTAVSSLNLVQDKRIRITYVVDPESIGTGLCYTYLNGIICGVYRLQVNDDFASSPDYPGYLNIYSTAGQVDIYNIRFYSSPLNAQTVLNNYQASLDTLEMRQKSYDLNQIRNIYGKIDLDIIESEDYEITIPYVKIIGGYGMIKTDDGDMVMMEASESNIPALPTGKKDFRGIDISVHYPKYNTATGANEYFKNYTGITITSEFGDSEANITNAFGKTMTKGAWMYAQGTSSMEYPVKNLRVKVTGGQKFTVQPDVKPVNLICFKADFMESSGSHNTGAGNLIDNIIYNRTGLKTPGQLQFDDETIVTCIKGHPCVIFWSPNGEKGTFSYIGKYNLNLDKATPEPFGFKEDFNDEKFGYLTNENNELIYDDNNEKINSIFCFEFLDNNERVCNFIHDKESEYVDYDINDDPEKEYINNNKTEEERYEDTWYSKRINEDGDIVPGWARGFESRHPEDKVDTKDADALWPLASWLNHLYAERYLRNNENAIEEFSKNYWKYLDKDFTIAYYVITEALLMADSRVKNMMIATWGKEWRYYNKITGAVLKNKPDDMTNYESYYGYIWYPIFYDMDTMLGLDNIGYRSKKYYDEDDVEDVFNGDEILWKFVRDGLSADIGAYYRKAETQNALRKEAILPCFNNNQANLANETFYNEDANYKYIDPYLAGHDGSRLFPAQGDRSLDREFFITNRLKYLSGKYNSTDYQEKDRFLYRLTSPTYTENPTTDRERLLNASILAVPPTDKFFLTSAKTCYGGVKVGTSFARKKFVGAVTEELQVPAGGANGTEVYVTGISSMTSIGDLSDKYPYGISLNGMKDSTIKQLILGNHHRDYYNPYWENEDAMDVSPLAYLEEFNLENCSLFQKGINFAAKAATDKSEATPGCGKIKKINLMGSSVNSISLPVGGVLEELRLPTTVTTLDIDSHQTLTPNGFTIGRFEYSNKTEGQYVNDFSGLLHVRIKDTPIDSYNLLKSALFDSDTINLEDYYIEGFNWELNNKNDFTVENGVVTGIKVLDTLLTRNPGESTHAQSLVGNLQINVSDLVIDEYAIYHYYIERYPNVNITYGPNATGRIEAQRINFYRMDATSLTEDTDITKLDYYYYTLSNGTKTLASLVKNEEFLLPIKAPSTTHTYRFSGVWVDWNTKQRYYQKDYLQEDANIINAIEFNDYIPNKDNTDNNIMYLVPEYIADIRYYKAIFYDYDKTEIDFVEGIYEANIGELTAEKIKLSYPYRDDSLLEDYQRYSFQGWISEKDYDENTQNPELYNLDELIFTKNIKLYAYYIIENVNEVPSPWHLFSINGTSISINPEQREVIQGKITIPSAKDGIYLTTLTDFKAMPKISGIYFLNDAKYTEVDNSCFYDNMATTINLPNSITTIGSSAFYNATKLININLGPNITSIGQTAFSAETGYLQVIIEQLPDSLTNIGERAFYRGGNNIRISNLPSNLNKIPRQCFMQCPNVIINNFPARSGDCEIGSQAFWGCGENSSINEITIHSPWSLGKPVSIYSEPFYDGYHYVNKVIVYSDNIINKYPDLEMELFGKLRTNLEVQEVIST